MDTGYELEILAQQKLERAARAARPCPDDESTRPDGSSFRLPRAAWHAEACCA